MLKVAIVGCGKIADGHVEEIQKLPTRAKVVAVCDREGLMAEQLAVRYAVPRWFDDLGELLARERPDVVHLTTPPRSHLPLAKQAIDAGAHVYVEKPFALSRADAEEILAYATKARRKVTVGYSSYFDPPAIEMRELVAAGVLGDPVHVESFYGYDLDGPFGQALLADGTHWVHGLPGKLFHNIIDHPLNKIVEFLKDDEPQVSAMGWRRRPARFGPGDARDAVLDELRVMLRGERVSAYATFSAHIRPAGQFVRVYGTKNTLHVDYVMRTVTVEATAKLPSAIGRLVPAFDEAAQYVREGVRNAVKFAKADFHFFAGLQRLIRLFYDSIVDDGPVPIPYRDIVRVSGILDEIFRQVPQGSAPGAAPRAQGAGAA
jgi:predicted dehydrogenase